jgi:ribosomal protein S7
VVNEHPDIQSQVIVDIEARRQVGIGRYGTALQPFNGRDALRDLYEELIDAAMYVKQLMVEREETERVFREGTKPGTTPWRFE